MSTEQRWKAFQCPYQRTWRVVQDAACPVNDWDEENDERVTTFNADEIVADVRDDESAASRATLLASSPELFDALEMLQIATLGYVKRPPVVQTALEVAEVALCKVRGTNPTGVKMDFGRSKHEALIDMLTKLMHANVGFDAALETARMHYSQEKKR